MGTLRKEAASRIDHLPGDPAGIPRRQERDCVRDIDGKAYASERNPAEQELLGVLVDAPRTKHFGIRGSWRDRVDRDALGTKLLSPGPRQRIERCFGRGIHRDTWDRVMGRDRTDMDHTTGGFRS